MEKSKEKRTCADCKYYEECVKGAFGNIPADACDFSDVAKDESGKEANNEILTPKQREDCGSVQRGILKEHIVASLDRYFANNSEEQITDDAMQEFYTTSNGSEYPLLRVNDVADENSMIEVAIVGQQYDVLKLAFLGRVKG